MNRDRLKKLLERKQAGILSAEELSELESAYVDDNNRELLNDVMVELMISAEPDSSYPATHFDPMLEAIVTSDVRKPKVVHIFRKRWLHYAASAILILGIGALFWPAKETAIDQPAIATNLARPLADIVPGSNMPHITLADGSIISLDSSMGKSLARQGNTTIKRLPSGEIVYMPSEVTKAIQYNILTVPRGSKVIDLILSDGSRVWLNAASSLKYPVAFTGKERKVEVSGEAYFEVTHDAAMPFIVQKAHSDLAIRVLGTRFNVNVYDDESAGKVTLLQGLVKVSGREKEALLKPGQQANIKNEVINIDSDVDLDEVMAWKNGRFQFGEKANIETIMRQISRWYNIEVQYEGAVRIHFGGSMSRQVHVGEVLDKLALTGAVKFRIENNQIIVIPVN